MAIPNPNPNIADGIKVDNKTLSSNKIYELMDKSLHIASINYSDLSISIGAGAFKDVFYNKDISADLPSGAKIKAIIACNTSPMTVIATQVANSDTKASIAVYNPGGGTTITTINFKVLYTL